MMVKELLPKVVNRLQFSFRDHKFVPQESGCYVLATFDEQILYVGLSVNLSRRFVDHKDNSEKTAQQIQGRAFWFYYLSAPELDINKIERSWLNQYSSAHGHLPPLNKVESPVN